MHKDSKKHWLLASSNRNKLIEWQGLLPDCKIELLPCSLPEIQATQATEVGQFKIQQALKKLPKNTQASGLFVEDVALHIQGLGGLPGALVKWFLEALGPAGLYELVKHENRQATAVCAVNALWLPSQQTAQFCGVVKGQIIAPSGEQGFGWDSIFLPDGQSKSYAAVNLVRKNLHSHRSKCAKEFLAWLQRLS